jgi:hypothetical protein
LTVNPASPGVIDPTTGLPASSTAAADAAASSLPDVASVYRSPGEGADADEGSIYEGANSSNAPQFVGSWRCSIEKPRSFSETMRGGVEQSISTYTARFEISADVQPTDEVRANGQRYQVTGTDAGISSALYLSVVMVKVS